MKNTGSKITGLQAKKTPVGKMNGGSPKAITGLRASRSFGSDMKKNPKPTKSTKARLSKY